MQTQNYYQHPKVLINIIIINSRETKMLFVKRRKKSYWDILGHILEYGETIDQRLKEILDETKSEDENIEKKLKFLCSFNAVDKDKKRHFVELIYAYKIDGGKMVFVDTDIFKSWTWMNMEEIKKDQIFYGLEIFFKKYKIKEIKDILKVNSI